MKLLFWLMLFFIFYCYFGYPLALFILARIKPRTVQKHSITPSVSIVIAVCDEEDVIAEKMQNLLAADYPKDEMEILIGSDGSKDATNGIIKGIKDSRIKLFEQAERSGKISMLNCLVPKAKNSIIIFTDARQTFAPNTIKELVMNFADPQIGCVSGELMLGGAQGATGKGINLYWEYEKFIRNLESKIHSMIGATGAIYAIRRELFEPAPEHVVLDDVYIPLKIVQKGYRAVFEPEARAYDRVAESAREEHSRKTRTLFGNYQIFTLFPQMFIPWRSPLAIQLFSHKFLRLLVPFFMVALFLINLVVIDEPGYIIIYGMQVIFYLMALVGALLRGAKYGIFKLVSRVCYVPYVFCLLNFSAFVGFLKFIQAKQDVVWEKARSQ